MTMKIQSTPSFKSTYRLIVTPKTANKISKVEFSLQNLQASLANFEKVSFNRGQVRSQEIFKITVPKYLDEAIVSLCKDLNVKLLKPANEKLRKSMPRFKD